MNVREMDKRFLARGSEFKYPATIRIRGLAIGVKVENSDYASELVDKCRRAGLLLTAEEDVLLFFPALNLDQKIAQQGLDILEECM
jgi:acetylornithine/succinyldiaminopimelate/putrescine aminotransferase